MRLSTWIAALAALAVAAPALAATVTGRVRDPGGQPVGFASVAAPALKLGTATDAEGRFRLELPAGLVTLEFVQLGYERRRLSLEVRDGLAPLDVTLIEEPVELAEVEVTASSFGKTGKSEGATLRRMDVLTTPGGAADVFQSLRALPGLNAPVEGAAVFVRGGPPEETLIRMDGGEIGHPYHYEGAGGGLFSALDSYLLKSAFFSSGGFSAKYGGVLSGVLDIETQDPMNLRTVSMGANLAGGGGSASWALVPDRLSVVGSWRMSDPGLLFRLYGSGDDFEVAPRARDVAGRVLYRYSPTGRVSALLLDTGDRSDLSVEYLGFRVPFGQRARTQLGVLQWQEAVGGRLALRGHLAGQFHRRRYHLGPFGGQDAERNAQATLEGVLSASSRHEIGFGAGFRRRDVEHTGRVAADSTDWSPDAPVRHLETRPVTHEPGFWLEDKMRVWGPLYATIGARVDRTSSSDRWTADPRAALAWRLGDLQTLRVAAGRYHQLPGARYLDPVYGNPRLGPMRADHLIAGYELKSDPLHVRLETYRKDYRDLVVNDAAAFYANRGHGYARGVDAFVQGGWRWLTGWVSYGWLDSRRKELGFEREAPTSHGVRHSLNLVGTYQITPALHLGARSSWATGRAWTPVVAARYDSAAAIWRPEFADDNSAELPGYHRLDVRLVRLFSLPRLAGVPESGVCVAYAEALNVLGRRNVLDVTYREDYSTRTEQESYFARRMVVFGFALTW